MSIALRRSGRAVAALLAVSMTLSACATGRDGSTPNIFNDLSTSFGSSDANLTPQQRALREREKEYSDARLTSTAVGVAAGALIGGLIGAAVGGGRGAAIGAGAGALAGGAAGYVGGTYLTRDNQNFQADRDTLQKDIDSARADTASMQRNVQAAEAVLADQRRQLNAINADLRAGRISEQQAREQARVAADDLNSVRNLRETADARVSRLEQSVDTYRRAGLPTGDLNRELNQQKQRAAQLRRVEQRMVTEISRVPPNIRPSVSATS